MDEEDWDNEFDEEDDEDDKNSEFDEEDDEDDNNYPPYCTRY